MSEVTDGAPEGQEEVIAEALDENISNDEDTEIETPVEDEELEESEELEALKDAPDSVKDKKWVLRRLGRLETKHKQASREDKQRIKELEALVRSAEIQKSQEKAQFNEVLTEEQKQEIQRREIEMQNLQFQVYEAAKEQEFARKMQEKAADIEDFSKNIIQLGDSGNFSDTMLLAAKNSPNGPDVIYHLSKNQREAARISRLPPDQQVREMYMLEGNMLNRTKPIKSSAPLPIDSTKAVPKSKTTSDPIAMSYSQMVDAEKKKYMR
jgi:hypothetical protein